MRPNSRRADASGSSCNNRLPRGGEWLPTEADRAQLRALQQPALERNAIAGWLAPPARGINNMPALDFDYVRL